ncbi:hypothetical protein DICVIV_08868 [Dictyocaulus viviparus]|uniref:Uncharacterized protein n=1 Tax=Dictyocaulus viviparus TaxID=29172 RepID=A0A0D8XKD6_DICVI|nr:hypothetical protein DICVIV_08868 [Dictyocaulus viviparus]
MASQPFDTVLSMVDKTVNSAGKLLKRLKSRSSKRHSKSDNENVRSEEDATSPSNAPDIPPLQTPWSDSDRKPSRRRRRRRRTAPDDPEANSDHCDVAIEHADNIFITYDSDVVAITASDKSFASTHSRDSDRQNDDDVIPRTEPLCEKSVDEIVRNATEVLTARGDRSRRSGRSVSAESSSFSTNLDARKLIPTEAWRSSRSRPSTKDTIIKYACRGLCRRQFEQTVLGPSGEECEECFMTMKKLQPRDPYRTSQICSTALKLKEKTSRRAKFRSKKSLATRYRKLRPIDPYRLPKKLIRPTTSKQKPHDKISSSKHHSKSSKTRSRKHYRRRHLYRKFSSKSSVKSITKKLYPKDPYRPPSGTTKTAITGKPVVGSSITSSISTKSKKTHLRGSYRLPTELSQTTDNKLRSSSKAKSRKKLYPRDPYRPPRKPFKANIPMKQDQNKKPSSQASKKLDVKQKPQISSHSSKKLPITKIPAENKDNRGQKRDTKRDNCDQPRKSQPIRNADKRKSPSDKDSEKKSASSDSSVILHNAVTYSKLLSPHLKKTLSKVPKPKQTELNLHKSSTDQKSQLSKLLPSTDVTTGKVIIQPDFLTNSSRRKHVRTPMLAGTSYSDLNRSKGGGSTMFKTQATTKSSIDLEPLKKGIKKIHSAEDDKNPETKMEEIANLPRHSDPSIAKNFHSMTNPSGKERSSSSSEGEQDDKKIS